jgi:AraC-like DNA-binding protein
MNKHSIKISHSRSVSELHRTSGWHKPKHPLFSVVKFEDVPEQEVTERIKLVADFYQIIIKKDPSCQMQYGQSDYDFGEGVMSFFAPKQVTIVEGGKLFCGPGWLLNIDPQFLQGFRLVNTIRDYGFFEYAVNEALILSEDEANSIETIFQQIEKEYKLPIDKFSQAVVLSNIELLLTYCSRYYQRQFVVRRTEAKTLAAKFERLMHAYFNDSANQGLPPVTYFASALNLSPKYLSDCLKQLTGETTQQHIQTKVIELAKEKLSTTELTVSEIAFSLGFEHPQSLSKFFKAKTNLTPLEYRDSLN